LCGKFFKATTETPSIKWKANIKADLRKINCEVSSYIQLFHMCPELVQLLFRGKFWYYKSSASDSYHLV